MTLDREQRVKQAHMLRERGKNTREIAAIMGLAVDTIQKYFHIPGQRPVRSENKKEYADSHLFQNPDRLIPDAARHLTVPAHAVRRFLDLHSPVPLEAYEERKLLEAIIHRKKLPIAGQSVRVRGHGREVFKVEMVSKHLFWIRLRIGCLEAFRADEWRAAEPNQK